MKRTFAFILVLSMLSMLTACGEAETPVTLAPNTGIQTTPAPETQPTETALEPVAFQELTVVDNAFCTIKITDIDPDNLWGYALGVYLENKSEEATYMVSVTSASVNGVEVDPLFASEVAPGKKANEEISFADTSLEENGVGEFTDIELNFRVYDSENWNAESIAESSVHVYPFGEENAAVFVREPKTSDNVIVDNDKVTITVTGYRADPIWGYTADLFIVNHGEVPIMVTVDEASVNGYMVDPLYADSVSPGKCAFSAISWSDTELEGNGITQVQELEFRLRVYREDDWTAEDMVNEVITLTP